MRDGFAQSRRPCRYEEIVGAVAVNIPKGEGSRSDRLCRSDDRARTGLSACETSIVCSIGELCEVGRRALSHCAQRDEVFRRKSNDRSPSDRTVGPFHIIQRGLIRRRNLHQPDEAIECCPRLLELSRP